MTPTKPKKGSKTKRMWLVLWDKWLEKDTKQPIGAIFGNPTNARGYAKRNGHELIPISVPTKGTRP